MHPWRWQGGREHHAWGRSHRCGTHVRATTAPLPPPRHVCRRTGERKTTDPTRARPLVAIVAGSWGGGAPAPAQPLPQPARRRQQALALTSIRLCSWVVVPEVDWLHGWEAVARVGRAAPGRRHHGAQRRPPHRRPPPASHAWRHARAAWQAGHHHGRRPHARRGSLRGGAGRAHRHEVGARLSRGPPSVGVIGCHQQCAAAAAAAAAAASCCVLLVAPDPAPTQCFRARGAGSTRPAASEPAIAQSCTAAARRSPVALARTAPSR